MRALFLVLSVALGCGGGSSTSDGFGAVGPGGATVGAPCTDDRQCASMCRGDMCAVRCGSDLDCPIGSSCIDSDSGICALACRANPDCPVGFECTDKDRKGASGKTFVCRKA